MHFKNMLLYYKPISLGIFNLEPADARMGDEFIPRPNYNLATPFMYNVRHRPFLNPS